MDENEKKYTIEEINAIVENEGFYVAFAWRLDIKRLGDPFSGQVKMFRERAYDLEETFSEEREKAGL